MVGRRVFGVLLKKSHTAKSFWAVSVVLIWKQV